MRCEEAETRLLELVDEELPFERRGETLSHLQTCTSCATEFSAYQNLLALVQAEAVPEPSPRFWEEFLPSLKHHIQQEAFDSKQESTGSLAGLRSWFVFSRPFIAGVAVAAVSILIVIRLPGFLPVWPDRHDTPPAREQSASRESGNGSVAMSPNADDVKRRSGEPYVLAGEIVDDPSALAAAIERLPWVNEIADRIETAWVQHPESDPAEWIASLSEEERQILLDRLRSFRWSQS